MSIQASRLFAVVAMRLLIETTHADSSGVVVAILDGDTVDVLVEQKSVRGRLAN